MGFGNRNKKSSKGGKSLGGKSKGKKDSEWRKILSMNESEKGGHYLSVDDYYGDLLFRDKETGDLYKVNLIGLFDPNDKAPDFVVYNGSVNLKNEKHVELLGNEGEAEESEEEEEEEESEEEAGEE